MKTVNLEKVVSEKSFANADALNKYAFYVQKPITKIDVKNFVEKEYKVKVVSVNFVTRPGKLKTSYPTRIKTRRTDMKKAIVTLKKGDNIKDFTKI